MEDFVQTETIIIGLLLLVSLIAMAVRRLRIPYTIALVIAGLIITFQRPVQLEIAPTLILSLFLPPLIFEAAFHINLSKLRANLPGILMLAIPGVIVSTLIVAGVLSFGVSLSLPLALVFGALISATDPVSVVATFKELNVPKRLGILVEAESLLNDGTAIVMFNVVIAIALTGVFDPVAGVFDFVRISAGGIAIGVALGWVISQMIARIDDYLVETTLTTVLAFGAYLLSDRLGFSGVLAVVAAGVITGNIGPRGMSATTRIVLFNFWEYLAFLSNSLVFLLIGLEVNVPSLLADWRPVLWAIGGVLLARAVVVYGLTWIVNRFSDPIPFRWQHILNWGGLRGAVSLALVLSLPIALGSQRELLRVMAFGVVLFSLVAQGATMRPLLQRLRLVERDEHQLEFERQHARLTALRSADKHLNDMHNDGLLSLPTWERLSAMQAERINALTMQVNAAFHADPRLGAAELDTAQRELLRAQRSALMSMRSEGAITTEVYEELAAEVDAALANEETNGTENGTASTE